MYKYLLSLQELSLELSNEAAILDRLDDSLDGAHSHSEEDISTESSSPFLKAIGIKSPTRIDKITLIGHLDKIHFDVARDIVFKSSLVTDAIRNASVYLKTLRPSYDINPDSNVNFDYKLDRYDNQTAQVNGRVVELNEFINHLYKLANLMSIVGDTSYGDIIKLHSMGRFDPDPGYKTKELRNLTSMTHSLNNAKVNVIEVGEYRFTPVRNDISSKVIYRIDSKVYRSLYEQFNLLVDAIDTASLKINFKTLLELYKKDRNKNKKFLDLVVKFYIPMFDTAIRAAYLSADILGKYRDNI